MKYSLYLNEPLDSKLNEISSAKDQKKAKTLEQALTLYSLAKEYEQQGYVLVFLDQGEPVRTIEL